MFTRLFGNETGSRVLLYLVRYNGAYAREMARNFVIPINMVQKQLSRFEDGGILVSQLRGRTRLYEWNPRYPFLKELRALLLKAFEFMPAAEIDKYFLKRTRPRRFGKPM